MRFDVAENEEVRILLTVLLLPENHKIVHMFEISSIYGTRAVGKKGTVELNDIPRYALALVIAISFLIQAYFWLFRNPLAYEDIRLFSNGARSTKFPSPLSLIAGRSIERTSKVGEAIGQELVACGINCNIAPVVQHVIDLAAEPSEELSRLREDLEYVSSHAVAFAQGLHRAGVVTCVTEVLPMSLQEVYRRFLDDTNVDKDAFDVIKSELQPLRHLLENGAIDSIMLSSCTSNFDDAETSIKATKFVVDEVVRKHLKFQGPVIVAQADPSDESIMCPVHEPLRALLSGSDMALLKQDIDSQQASVGAMYAAIEADPQLRLAVSASYERVKSMKARRLLSLPEAEAPSLPYLVSTHRTLAEAAYRASITALQPGLSPLTSLPSGSTILLLTPTVPPINGLDQQFDPFEPLGRALSRFQPRIRHVPYTLSSGLSPTHLAFLSRVAAVVLVLATTTSILADAQTEIWNDVERSLSNMEVSRSKTARLVVSAGDVRDLYQEDLLGKGWWGVACWDYHQGALEAVAEVLGGQREATGVLPIKTRR
ncbi:hypothetical protein MMC11_003861 [Xylographa trunciseda]|nr:hypothetical protein [Xylographa trunciseda]